VIEISGWLGGFLLSICGIPQAYKSYKEGHSDGLDWFFFWLWFWGEVFLLIYVIPEGLLPLIINYSFNIFLPIIMIYYKWKPRYESF